ncbi:type III secretion system inner membrane ring lipoprotein SctJ [Pseudomonas sp.]|uniref:type III secretion system inner membrane ring lipoprotein SctJ n=1 Tax=Pseudomonas sp. TaxID=306 RepID=UPI002633A529|nr:type III secretion inner membrane ring lipoprotein SctJ [Pseudomonas sp.]
MRDAIKYLFILFLLHLAGCTERVELHSQLTEQEANQVIAELADKQIYAQKISTKNAVSVRVNSADIHRAVNVLEAAGLPQTKRSNLGDIFRKEGVISTPLEERARYIYALSQELEATFSKIDGVIIARVHVVLPERVAPGEPVQPASASVFIKHDASLDPDSIQSRVRKLVASSIPGMASAVDNPHKITTVFIPSTAYQEKQKLVFFGPFLVPEHNVGFWRNVFVSIALGLPFTLITIVLWLKKPFFSTTNTVANPNADSASPPQTENAT